MKTERRGPRLTVEKSLRALEHGNPDKVAFCKVKTQSLPVDFFTWKVDNTVESNSSTVARKPDNSGMGIG